VTPDLAQAAQPALAAPAAAEAAGPARYSFLNLDEAAFVYALVDHMIPADEISPKAPISASTFTSIGRWPAPGRKANALYAGTLEARQPEPAGINRASCPSTLSLRLR
jgi:hypothetical protein